MSESRIEDLGAVIVVGPCDNRFLPILSPFREGMGSIEDRDIVVEFLVLSRPIFETLSNRMLLVRVDNFDRLLKPVTAGLQTEIFEPLREVVKVAPPSGERSESRQ